MLRHRPDFAANVPILIRTFNLLVLLQVAFLTLLFSSNLIKRDVIEERIRHGFATGQLVEQDYLQYDADRGWHQYNDCNILQMMTNRDSSTVGRALGPLIYQADSSFTEVCRTLREMVVDGRDPATFIPTRYTRYWHGYIPILSFLLAGFEIATVRNVLRTAAYVSILALLFSSIREKRFFLLTGPAAFFGLFFWGLPYFGLGMSHALGDIVVMIGIASLVFWHRQLAAVENLVPFSALFGATVVFFEMLTGPLPVAAGFLFPTVYLASRLSGRIPNQPGDHLRLSAVALIAFALGGIFSLIFKYAAVALLVRPSGFDLITRNIALYTSPIQPGQGNLPGVLQSLTILLGRGEIMTYGSDLGLKIMYVVTFVAWILAFGLAWMRGNRLALVDFAAFAIGAAAVPVWTSILQTHTAMHAGFMARILIVPISLGWAAASWQLWVWRRGKPQLHRREVMDHPRRV